MAIEFSIESGLLAYKQLLKDYRSKSHHLLSIYLLGDLVGSLNQDGSIAYEAKEVIPSLIDSILSLKDLKDLSLNSYIGNFSVLVFLHEQSKLVISTSTSGITPFVQISGAQKIMISFDENKILADNRDKLSDLSFEMISLSHQLVNRFPFDCFDIKNIQRFPSGHTSILDIQEKLCSCTPFLNKSEYRFSSECLKRSIDSILMLYHAFYKDDLGLLFSGGLDSSCLASSLYNSKIKIPFYHIDYKGERSSRSRVAHFVSAHFGYNTVHLSRYDQRLTLEDMIHNCTAGFVTCPNLMYLGSPINQHTKPLMPKYLISGQGADSIYVIDSFAPSTEEIGVARIENIVKTAGLRLALTSSKIYEFLEIDRTGDLLMHLRKNQKFISLLMNQCSSLSEHVSYTNISPVPNNSLNSFRSNNIAKKIFNALPDLSLSSGKNTIIEVYRYIKWMRSLINVPSQYASSFCSEGVIKLTPFLEGPIVNMFFCHELSSIESISIKHELEHLFHCNSGISHRSLIELALNIESTNLSSYGQKSGAEMDKGQFKQLANATLSHLQSLTNNTKLDVSFKNFIKDPIQLVRIGSLLK